MKNKKKQFFFSVVLKFKLMTFFPLSEKFNHSFWENQQNCRKNELNFSKFLKFLSKKAVIPFQNVQFSSYSQQFIELCPSQQQNKKLFRWLKLNSCSLISTKISRLTRRLIETEVTLGSKWWCFFSHFSARHFGIFVKQEKLSFSFRGKAKWLGKAEKLFYEVFLCYTLTAYSLN